jgi:hypothetical protein
MRLRAVLSLLIMLFAFSAWSAPAWAGNPHLDEAKQHFNRGVDLYDDNDFTGALVEFKRAYELSQDFHVLFNIAQTQYQVQNYAGALDAFQRYVTDGGSGVDAKRRTYVDKEIQKLRGRVATVKVVVNVPGADILVDDEKVGTSPLSKPLTVSQGRRKITASIDGKPPATKTIEVAGGDNTSVDLQIESESAATPPPPPPPPAPVETHRKVPLVPWIVAGGLFVGAAVTGTLALVFKSDFDGKLNTYGVTAADINGAHDTAKAFAAASDIFSGCTLVAAGVALVMTLTATPTPVEGHARPQARVRFLVGPGSVGVAGAF